MEVGEIDVSIAFDDYVEGLAFKMGLHVNYAQGIDVYRVMSLY